MIIDLPEAQIREIRDARFRLLDLWRRMRWGNQIRNVTVTLALEPDVPTRPWASPPETPLELLYYLRYEYEGQVYVHIYRHEIIVHGIEAEMMAQAERSFLEETEPQR